MIVSPRLSAFVAKDGLTTPRTYARIPRPNMCVAPRLALMAPIDDATAYLSFHLILLAIDTASFHVCSDNARGLTLASLTTRVLKSYPARARSGW